MDTVVRPSLADLFDRHASLVIDIATYQTNPTMRAAADRIFALVGVAAADVRKTGVRMFRSYAVFDVRERTADGKPVLRGDEFVWRTVAVRFDDA